MSKRFFFQQSVADIADGVQRAEAKHGAVFACQLDGLADTGCHILAGSCRGAYALQVLCQLCGGQAAGVGRGNADELLYHIRELVELENGVNFTGNAEVGIVLTEEELDVVFSLRRVLADSASATDSLIDTMQKTKNNADFLSKAKAFINAQGK